MSSYKDVENIVKDVQGSNSKATESSGLSFGRYKEVPHIDTHTQNVARTQTHTRTHVRTNARTHTHTHTRLHYFQSLCFPISATREMFKVPSTYRPGTFSILSETLSCTSRIPTQKMALKGVRQVQTIRKFFSD